MKNKVQIYELITRHEKTLNFFNVNKAETCEAFKSISNILIENINYLRLIPNENKTNFKNKFKNLEDLFKEVKQLKQTLNELTTNLSNKALASKYDDQDDLNFDCIKHSYPELFFSLNKLKSIQIEKLISKGTFAKVNFF